MRVLVLIAPLPLIARALGVDSFVCHHEILGVVADSSKEELTKAFREAAKRSHPDMPRGSQHEFVRLRQAYDSMADADRRAEYQRALKDASNLRTCRATAWDVARQGGALSTVEEVGKRAVSRALQVATFTLKTTAAAVSLLASTGGRVLAPLMCEAAVQHLVYLDDSSSMLGTTLAEAHSIFADIAPGLRDQGAPPLRLTVFGSDSLTLLSQVRSFSDERVFEEWKGRRGGTYMWHMILQDIQKHFPVSQCRSTHFRVYVITDGQDTSSPRPFVGMAGMDPMMLTLLGQGYDIEFHVVVVGNAVSGRDSERYQRLAQATGGLFLPLRRASSRERRDFVLRSKEFARATAEEAAKLRGAERQKYEAAIQQGRAKKFDWHSLLPPPE